MDIRKSKMWILLLLVAVLLMLIYGMKSSCGENLKDRGADGNRRMLCVDTPWEDHKISRIVVEDGVTSIGNYAFAFCPGLREIVLPDTVTSIGDSVLDGSESLEMIYVAEGSYAESYCISNELPYAYMTV